MTFWNIPTQQQLLPSVQKEGGKYAYINKEKEDKEKKEKNNKST